MNILLLAFVIILFLSRIKNTPKYLSEDKWKEQLQQTLDQLNTYDKEHRDLTQCASMLTYFIVNIVFIIVYILIGLKIGTTLVLLLSAFQIVTVLWDIPEALKVLAAQPTSTVAEFKYHELQRVLNVLLDYIYYPIVLYYLITIL